MAGPTGSRHWQAALLLAALSLAGCGAAPLGGAKPDVGLPEAKSLSGSYLASRVAGLEDDFGAAAHYTLDAFSRAPDDETLARRAVELLVATGDVPRATEIARRFGTGTGDFEMALLLAVDAIARGDRDDAQRRLADLGTAPAARSSAALLGAWVEAKTGSLEGARTALQQLPRIEGRAVFEAYHTGLVADLLGSFETAIENYARAHDLNPRSSRIADAYARALERAGRTVEAAAVYAAFAKESPDHPILPAAELRRARRAFASGPYITDPAAGAGEALFGIAAGLAGARNPEVPLFYAHLALHLAPRLDVAHVLIAEIHAGGERWEPAIAAYAAIEEGSIYWAEAERQRARALDRLDRTDEAIGRLRRLAESRPNDVEALIALGDLLRRRERWGEAAEVFDRAIAQLPRPDQAAHWTAYYARGVARERSGQWTLAEADFRRALELSPDQPLVLNYLGYSWIDRGENITEAKALVRRAVELAPDAGFIVDSLGWAYFRLGEFAEAVVQLERAMQLEPGDPTITDHLGDAYWRVGREREARFMWRRALGYDPDPDLKAAIEGKLDRGLPPLGQAAETP